MLINLHIFICLVFFFVGFTMRYGLARPLVLFLYSALPYLSRKPYDELTVRKFIGETSIKLGGVIFMIAMVGILKPESFNLAMLAGWICFAIIAVGSVTFLDKTNLLEKHRQAKRAIEKEDRHKNSQN